MTAAVQARSLTITVNGNNWSQNLVSFEIGFESYSQGTGLILKKGTLTLCNVYGDSRLIDPVDQPDFNAGNNIEVSITGVGSHPVGGKLKILAVPEVSAIDKSIPAIEGNIVIAIPVGCNLSFYKRDEPDEDATNVNLGSPVNLSTVVRNCLVKAGIPLADIALSTTLDSTMPFKFSKNGGGWIDFSGELTYSGRSQTNISPCYLYCDNLNVVRVKQLQSPKTTSYTGVTVTVGTNDRGYERQLDTSLTPGVIEMSGIQRTVKDLTDDYPYTDTETNDISTETTTYYKGNSYKKVLPSNKVKLPEVLFDGDDFPSYPYAGANGTQGDLTFIQRRIFLNSQTSEEWVGSLTDKDGYIVYEFQIRFVEAEILYPAGWKQSDYGTDAEEKRKYLTIGEAICITYELGRKGQIKTKTTRNYANLFKAQPSADFNDDFDTAFSNSVPMKAVVMSKKTIETWTEINQNKTDKVKRYTYKVSEFAPRIVNNPAYESEEEFPSAAAERADRWRQEVKVSVVNKRNTTPPQAQQWSGIYQVEEEQLTGNKTFGTGINAKGYRLQSPFWFSGSQPDIFAEIEGEYINGRQYQYIVQCDPSLLFSVYEPMKGITILEPGLKRYVIADALSWYHSATETYVAFAGIFAGSSGLAGTVPVFFPGQLVSAPQPTATIIADGFILLDSISGSADPDE